MIVQMAYESPTNRNAPPAVPERRWKLLYRHLGNALDDLGHFSAIHDRFQLQGPKCPITCSGMPDFAQKDCLSIDWAADFFHEPVAPHYRPPFWIILDPNRQLLFPLFGC